MDVGFSCRKNSSEGDKRVKGGVLWWCEGFPPYIGVENSLQIRPNNKDRCGDVGGCVTCVSPWRLQSPDQTLASRTASPDSRPILAYLDQ